MDINKIEVNYQGRITTIGEMKSDLETGHAGYWYWHELINMFESKYRKIRATKSYGLLLPEMPIINKTPCWTLEGRIAQGGYDKVLLNKLIEMYGVLLQEEERT